MNLDSIKEWASSVATLVLGLLAWAGIIALLILLGKGCDWVKRTNAETREQRAETELSQFCSASNATPAFKGLPKHDLLTIDLQRSLFVNEKRVAFRAKLSNVWKSKKYGTMMVRFTANYGDNDIDAYLKCTEAQAQKLHDQYQTDKDATFLVAAEFERAEAFESKSRSNSEADSERTYDAIGTLAVFQVAKEAEPNHTSASQDPD